MPAAKPVKKKKPKIKVTPQKGVVKGTMSVFKRESRNEDPAQHWSGSPDVDKKISAEEIRKAMRDCFARTNDVNCFSSDHQMNEMMQMTGPVARAMAVNLVTQLRLPAPTPIFGPDPNVNEWKMLAVGFPIWLWTDGPTSVSTTASSSGFTFRLAAQWRSTTFHMGDGRTVTCTSMAKYSTSVTPGAPSPNCGHVYTQPSLPKGKYQVRAVADWEVTWSVAGFSGVLPAYNEASASIPIGELVALNR
ncbi:MAG: hypothetical protein QM582_10000 [Micropruina sp.]|uniref:hypothetical protein n=1 Tax=Micropruina sp. TaxID=2737536 RepID=UPI0039E5E498